MRKYIDKIKIPVPGPNLLPAPPPRPEQKWPGSLPVPGRGPRPRPTLVFSITVFHLFDIQLEFHQRNFLRFQSKVKTISKFAQLNFS